MFQRFCFALFILAVSNSLWAGNPEPELLMRSGPGSSFQIPLGSSWSSATPVINNQRQVGLTINAVAPSFRAGIWQGDPNGGGIVAIADDDDSLFSDVSQNDDGDLVWRRAFSSQDGIMKFDAGAGTTAFLTNAPLGASSWTAVQINNAGTVGYRAGFTGGNAWTTFSGGASSIHLAETGIDAGSDYEFLFTPSHNQNGLIAGKAAFQSLSQNRIITADSSGTVTVRVNDATLDINSPFSSFNNSVDLNESDQIAFVANLTLGGRGVYVATAGGWSQYAIQGSDGLGEIEFFSPVLNNDGVLAFRGFNQSGQRSIWRADGQQVTQIATTDDLVQTDIGPARLRSPTEVGGPNFGGAPAINDHGDIVFVSLLTDPDDPSISFGRGVFLIRGGPGDPVFQDRFEE